jgi:biopolymer transport protein ExbD
MKKCSRSAHRSLTALNITPLLDLAFVLLVIFIITTTPIVNDLAVKLPTAAPHLKDSPRKANFITLKTDGSIWLNHREVDLAGLPAMLAGLRVADPDLNLVLRGDAQMPYARIRPVLAACQQANVLKVDLATAVARP